MIRHREPSADPLDHLDAVHVRQAEVDDDEIRWLFLRGGESAHAVLGQHHVIPASGQVDPHRPQQLLVVVDDQDPGHRPAPA